MLCKIADFLVEVPDVENLRWRCDSYLTDEKGQPDVVIDEKAFEPERWPLADYKTVCYMESARLFYYDLLRLNGMMLHASAVEYEGKAYLFSGPSTVGKSTHTRLWKKCFGEGVQIFNDDKPALRCIDGQWFAYGTPWCGKDGINQNKKVPVAGICFLKQEHHNSIQRLSPKEAMLKIVAQSTRRSTDPAQMGQLLSLVDKLVREVPVYLLENTPTPEAAQLSYKTMCYGIDDEGERK